MSRSSPLHQAVIEQDPERVAALIEQGANVLAKNEHGFTALQIAFRSVDSADATPGSKASSIT